MPLSDAARQIALVADTAKRTAISARLPVRFEPRRPGMPAPGAVDALPGDGAGGDAEIVGMALSKGLPQTSARAGDPASTSGLRIRIANGRGGFTNYDVEHAGGDQAGETAVVPSVVSLEIELLEGVDYADMANTHRPKPGSSSWQIAGGSGLDAEQRSRLNKIF